MDESERWLPVTGYEGTYEVSDQYRLRRLGRITEHGKHKASRKLAPRLLKTSKNNGYLVAYLGGNGTKGTRPKKLYIENEVEALFGIRPKRADTVDSPGEEWREIASYEGLYEVSNFGRIRSMGWYVNGGPRRRYVQPRIRNQNLTSVGYFKVELARQGTTKTLSIHRLVAVAFIPNPLNLEVVHHIDENKLNNRADNLEWVTRASNVQDWFDRRRVVITQDAITRIGDALAAGKSPAEILASLPRKRKTKNKG